MQFQQLGVVSIMEEQLDMFYMNSVQLHRKKYKGMISNNYKWLFPFANVEKNLALCYMVPVLLVEHIMSRYKK